MINKKFLLKLLNGEIKDNPVIINDDNAYLIYDDIQIEFKSNQTEIIYRYKNENVITRIHPFVLQKDDILTLNMNAPGLVGVDIRAD